MEPNSLTPPPRSVLLRPVPKGFGTGQVQSLPSYMYDVGALHELQVGQLISHFCLGPRQLNGGPAYQIWNWVTRDAYLVEVFGTLTMRDDLHFLTPLPLKAVLADKGLRSPHAQWCPLCLREDPYGRLLWTFQEVKACPIHKIMLESACEGCGAVTSRNAMRPAWHFCGCGQNHSKSKLTRVAGPEELWRATQISELLAKGFENPQIKVERLQEVLWNVLLPMFGSMEKLRRHTGISYTAAYGDGGKTLRITSAALLGAARSVGLGLVDLLTAPLTELRPQIGAPATTIRPFRAIPKKELRKMVKSAMGKMPAERRSLLAVAKKVGVSTNRIRKQLPEIAAKLLGDRRRKILIGHARTSAASVKRMVVILRNEPLVSDSSLVHRCGLSLVPRTQKLVNKARQLAVQAQAISPKAA